MSSTNVHSRNGAQKHYHINCGQTIANNKGEIEIPPKTAKKGPSTLEIEQGLAMDIPVETSELRKDGKLVSRGSVVATFEPEAFSNLDKKRANKEKTDKGNDR